MNLTEVRDCAACHAVAEFHCHGCHQRFCPPHADEHRQSLNEQLDWLTVDHDDFVQTVSHASSIPKKDDHNKEIIDRWERDSIRHIRKTASDAREALIEARKTHIDDIKEKLATFTETLHRAYQQESVFDERNIKQWSSKLHQLEQELTDMSTFAVRIHGSKPVVMPIIKIQPNSNGDSVASEPQPTSIGVVPLKRPVKSTRSLSNGTMDDKTKSSMASKFPLNPSVSTDDRFHLSSDHVTIGEHGQTIVHDSSKSHASIRGLREYSQGEHKLYFRLERMTSDRCFFIGILSKQATAEKSARLDSSAVGWTAGNQSHNLFKSRRHDDQVDLRESDLIELTIDCERRAIHLWHSRKSTACQLSVDLKQHPFPWQFVVSLRQPNDAVRMLPLSMGAIMRQEEDKSKGKKNGWKSNHDLLVA